MRATQIAQSASLASDVQIFCPVSRQPRQLHRRPRSARVVSPARSEPAPGSLNSWHQMISPRSVAGRKRSCCSGVPYWTRAGTTQAPMSSPGGRSPAALISSAMTSCSSGLASRPQGRGQVRDDPAPGGQRGAAGPRRAAPRWRPARPDLRPHAAPPRRAGRPLTGRRAPARRQPGHPLGPPVRTGPAARAATAPGGSTGARRAPRCSRCRRAPGCTRAVQLTAASRATTAATAAAKSAVRPRTTAPASSAGARGPRPRRPRPPARPR